MAFALPETLDGLSADELQALIDAGLDDLKALGITEDSDEATVAAGEKLVADITAVSNARKAMVDRRKRAAGTIEAAKALTPEAPKASDPDPEPEPEPAPAPEPEGEPEPKEGEPDAVLTPDAVTTPEGELVTAGASPARRAAANAKPNVPARRPRSEVTLLASADVPGFAAGQALDGLDAVTAAVLARMRGLPTARIGGPDGVRHQYGAASIRMDFGDLVTENGPADYGVVEQAANERRLPGGSLVAAGGWCAPSETFYDMCQYETVDGILQTPEISVPRGGIRWTQGPSFDDIYAGCGFQLTEAEAIAGTAEKDCCMVECPPFEEIRLDAVGLCVRAPLLTQAAYPELTRRFMEGALVAHAHKVNAYMLGALDAAAGANTTLPDAGSTWASLEYLEMLAIGMRYQYRMAQSASIEVIAPFWVKAILRADRNLQAFADGTTADAWIDAWFAARNMSVQWVYDWQDLEVQDCTPVVPEDFQLLMYPAGTWVKGRLDVININAVYDSTSLAENVYTAVFMEEGILAVQRCTHTCRVTVPVCMSGARGALDIECLGALVASGGDAFTAAAGTPGTWGPSGSTPPASVAALQAGDPETVTASPTTAWTTGQYVQTQTAGAPGRAHWNGTAWAGGAAS